MTCNPLIGQHVHYTPHTTTQTQEQPPQHETCRPATITAQYDATGHFLALHILTPTGTFHNNSQHSNNHEPGTWHWPPPHPQHKQTIINTLNTLTNQDLNQPNHCHECGANQPPELNPNNDTTTTIHHQTHCSQHPNNTQ